MIATDPESCFINWRNENGKASRSISFSLCYQFVRKNQESRALFICDRSTIERDFPETVTFERSQSNHFLPVYLNKIDMKYVQDHFTLKKILASLHLWLNPPGLIVISDLSLIIDPLRTMPRGDSAFMELTTNIIGLIDDLSRYFLREKGFRPRVVITDDEVKVAYTKLSRALVPVMWELTLTPEEALLLTEHTGTEWAPSGRCDYFVRRGGGYTVDGIAEQESNA